jgi:hypothetical protein
MSDSKRPEERLGEDLDEEYVPEDDRIIGRVFKWSLLVIGGIIALVVLVRYISQQPEDQAPEQQIQATAPEAVVQQQAVAPQVLFTDITLQAGIDFVHVNGAYGDKLLPESMGGGAAFFDYDNDGDQDLLLVNSCGWPHRPALDPAPITKLYRNDGSGAFKDVTAAVGLDVQTYGMGVALADYDNDGWTDVFITAVGPNQLFRNQKGQGFVAVTDQAGVAGGEHEWSSSAAFFDMDNDGDMDLFVANYIRWSKAIDDQLDFRLTGVGRAYGPPKDYQGTFPYLYRNNGDGTFKDVTAAAGVQVKNSATGAPAAKSLAIGPIDVDRDGWMDMLIANDTVQNYFFHNNGDGTFEETGEFFGLAYGPSGNATGAMGVDAGHYRNDHNIGFAIGNFANEMTSLYVTQDDPHFFVDDAIGEGIGAPSRRVLTFGLFFFDYDLDGRLDMLQTNGHVEDEIEKVDSSQEYRQAPQLFWNAGPDQTRGFMQIPLGQSGDLDQKIVGRGATYADIDNDGDLDVLLTQVAGPPLLLRNDQATGHHWLRLKLKGQAPNRSAIGAWVELEAGGILQRRQVMPTRSYLSQAELPITFGLGAADQIESLKVIWPDGSEQRLDAVELNQLVVVEQ